MKGAVMKQRQQPSTTKLLVLSVLFLAIVAQICGSYVLKSANWDEDGRVMDTRSRAWLTGRQYSEEVEGGLTLLNEYEPRQVAYLRSRGNPIEFIPCSKGRRGYTSNPEGVVHVCQQYRIDPAAVAVVLSHECVHLERHDPDTRPKEHSFPHRLFGYTEEQAAHWRSLRTAWRMWPKYHSVWNVMGWEWLLDAMVWVWPTPIVLLEFPLVIALGVRIVLTMDSSISARRCQADARVP